MNLIYLDNASTTQVDPRVVETMIPYFLEKYANSSSNHLFGTSINNDVKVSRNKIAEIINSENNEVIFTSGATEAINLSIKGVASNYSNKGKHIVTVQTEHSAVLDVCKYLETNGGYDITYLPVDEHGIINLDQLKHALRQDTILVSVMYVNNETGVIQPIKEISEITHNNNSIFMTDATQAFGKIPIDVNDLGVDLMSFSGHKIYGPKGIGVLYCRNRGKNKVKIHPLIHGGGHERGLRSGTSNVPGIIGLSKAAEIAVQEIEIDKERINRLRDILENELLKIDNSFINGHKEKRIYNITNICFRGVDADAVITGLKNIAVSNGSACTSTSLTPSHVLKALGKSDDDAYSSIRFSLGKFNNETEIKRTIAAITIVINELKGLIS
ncbi:MAG TPA: cysteine desulfurase family protein [Ignavibacteriaceae bacterium]|nr:cysteine desulfurase family protein [Ignavibacteriaceae bacterium]